MVPILNALNVQCAVYGNHDFGMNISIVILCYSVQSCHFCLFHNYMKLILSPNIHMVGDCRLRRRHTCNVESENSFSLAA